MYSKHVCRYIQYMCMHTYIHTYMHTYIHTYIYIYIYITYVFRPGVLNCTNSLLREGAVSHPTRSTGQRAKDHRPRKGGSEKRAPRNYNC